MRGVAGRVAVLALAIGIGCSAPSVPPLPVPMAEVGDEVTLAVQEDGWSYLEQESGSGGLGRLAPGTRVRVVGVAYAHPQNRAFDKLKCLVIEGSDEGRHGTARRCNLRRRPSEGLDPEDRSNSDGPLNSSPVAPGGATPATSSSRLVRARHRTARVLRVAAPTGS